MKHFLLITALLLSACARVDDPPAPSAETPQPTPQEWTVTENSAGPLRVGMTVPEAKAALGSDLTGSDSGEPCYVLRPGNGVNDLLIMVVDGRIVRLDVVGASIPTDTGARVGDSESRIEMLYPAKVTVSPHKYTDGHYLTVGYLDKIRRLALNKTIIFGTPISWKGSARQT